MKIKDKKTIQLIADAYKAIEARKRAEKKEKQLKDAVKSICGKEKVVEADIYFIIIDRLKRESVDRKLVQEMLSEKEFKKVLKITEYEKMQIKKAA